MSSADGVSDDAYDEDSDPEELAAQVELLAEENQRLRAEYRRARKTRYRQTALGFAILGLVALGGAVVFPGSREVLLALSGTGLFAAVLVRSLTPERFIAAPVGERVYEAHAETGERIVADLGLSDHRMYLPTASGEESPTARLYVPQHETFEMPDPEDLDGAFVVGDRRRGVVVQPTGAGLFREFRRDLTGDPAEDPETLGEQLVDGLVDGFELLGAGRVDAEDGRLSVSVRDSTYGDVTEFDHPVASFIAVAVASALDEPVSLETVTDDDGRFDAVVTCRWDADEE